MPKMTAFELALQQLLRRKRRRRSVPTPQIGTSHLAGTPNSAKTDPSATFAKAGAEIRRFRSKWEESFLSRQFPSASARARHREMVERYISGRS